MQNSLYFIHGFSMHGFHVCRRECQYCRLNIHQEVRFTKG